MPGEVEFRAGFQSDPEIPELTLEDLGLQDEVEGGSYESDNEWSVVNVDPEKTVSGPNIRETNWNHVKNLARSFMEQGQLQECIGEELADGTIRVWAGQHRRLALIMLNRFFRSVGQSERSLRVRVYPRELSADQVFAIQLAENLHNQMTPAEEADAIVELWQVYLGVFGEEGANAAELARRIGRGPDKVYDALHFAKLDPRVADMVRRGVLLYSRSVEIARCSQEHHLEIASKAILYRLNREGVENLVKYYLGIEQGLPGLFSGETIQQLGRENHVLAMRGAAARSAQEAAGYFERVLFLLSMVEETESVRMTDTIRDILASLVVSSDVFRDRLEESAPHLLSKIMEAVEAGVSVLKIDYSKLDSSE